MYRIPFWINLVLHHALVDVATYTGEQETYKITIMKNINVALKDPCMSYIVLFWSWKKNNFSACTLKD